MQNLPLIRLFLAPIMDRQARENFNHIQSNSTNAKWVNEYGASYAAAIVRSVVTTKTPPNLRIRQGLLMLMNGLGVSQQQALEAIKNPQHLRKVLKPGDPVELITAIENYIKWLGNTISTGALVHDLNTRAYRESQEQLLQSEKKRKKQKTQSLSNHEIRRLQEKARMLAEITWQQIAERQRRIELAKQKKERQPKKPMRWLA